VTLGSCLKFARHTGTSYWVSDSLRQYCTVMQMASACLCYAFQ